MTNKRRSCWIQVFHMRPMCVGLLRDPANTQSLHCVYSPHNAVTLVLLPKMSKNQGVDGSNMYDRPQTCMHTAAAGDLACMHLLCEGAGACGHIAWRVHFQHIPTADHGNPLSLGPLSPWGDIQIYIHVHQCTYLVSITFFKFTWICIEIHIYIHMHK